ncbi:flagellar basal body P-ring protein FlgI [Bacteriovoracaceae bacterium]|nr:flagellar basal body P-ring protein FlgI [Bacteriovoracaceae bacterium]
MLWKLTLITLSFFISLDLFSSNRLKDVLTIKGVRENPIIGYGLVIGLNGTGDSGGEVTNESLIKMFQTLGLNPKKEVASANVAAVIVTAKMPHFGRIGQKIDVTVSSIGSASSLAGGTLLVTPLKGGDGKIYAISSGALTIGGLTQGSKYPTTGRVINGATVEQEVEFDFNNKRSLRFALNRADFTTAARIEKVLNKELGGKFATASDSATIDLIVPTYYSKRVVELIAIIENFKIEQDRKSKIIINERTGTIVAGGQITLEKVAISHGDLVIEVGEGEKTGKADRLHLIERSTTISDLVKSLNALGTSPEDLISIFQTLKKNGSISAEIEFI